MGREREVNRLHVHSMYRIQKPKGLRISRHVASIIRQRMNIYGRKFSKIKPLQKHLIFFILVESLFGGLTIPTLINKKYQVSFFNLV